MASSLAVFLLPALLLAGQADQPARPAPTDKEIKHAIEDLASSSAAIQKAAYDFLWQAGNAVEPALETATKSDNHDTSHAAGVLLDKFQHGLYADTPREILELVEQCVAAEPDEAHSAFTKLDGLKAYDAMLYVLKNDRLETFRDSRYAPSMSRGLRPWLLQRIAQSDFRKAEEILEFRLSEQGGDLDYVAFFAARGQLAEQIAKTEKRPPTQDTSRLLVILNWALGDLPAVRRALRDDDSGRCEVLTALRAWDALAKDEEQQTDINDNACGWHLGWLATCHRLAGHSDLFATNLAAYKEIVEVDHPYGVHLGVLSMNDRFQDLIDVAGKSSAVAAFQLLVAQDRLREAFASVGVHDLHGSYADWFDNLQSKAAIDQGRFYDCNDLGLEVAKELIALGEIEEAGHLIQKVAGKVRVAKDDADDSMLGSLYEVELQAGLGEDALRHAAAWLTQRRPTPARYLSNLKVNRPHAAPIWWKFFRKKRPKEPREETVRRIHNLLGPAIGERTKREEFQDLMRAADKMSARFPPEKRAEWLRALGETCLEFHERAVAREYLLRAASQFDSVALDMQIARLFWEDGQWRQSGDWYEKAWQKDRQSPALLYLEGEALVRAGLLAEGRRSKELASLLLLGDRNARLGLAARLEQLGLAEEAEHQFQLVKQLGPIGYEHSRACFGLARLIERRDPQCAANYAEDFLFGHFVTCQFFMNDRSYLDQPQWIHELRAQGALKGGNIEQAIDEIHLSQAALPGGVDLPIDLLPSLQEAGLLKVADTLFSDVFAVRQQMCDDFPRSATAHDNLAWLAAGCRRRLDDGLQHARRALELRPDDPTTLDTLAQVHFQIGQQDQAIEVMKRCIELVPDKPYYPEQLERFKRGNAREELPPLDRAESVDDGDLLQSFRGAPDEAPSPPTPDT